MCIFGGSEAKKRFRPIEPQPGLIIILMIENQVSAAKGNIS